jgi:hypothetical protein
MQESMRLASRWLTWFCLSLMLWTAAVESSHHHPNKTQSAACSICVVAHSTTPTASSHHTPPLFTAIDLLQEKEIIAEARIHCSDLGIRSPPAA